MKVRNLLKSTSMKGTEVGTGMILWVIGIVVGVSVFASSLGPMANSIASALANENISGVVAIVIGFTLLVVTALFFKKLANHD